MVDMLLFLFILSSLNKQGRLCRVLQALLDSVQETYSLQTVFTMCRINGMIVQCFFGKHFVSKVSCNNFSVCYAFRNIYFYSGHYF